MRCRVLVLCIARLRCNHCDTDLEYTGAADIAASGERHVERQANELGCLNVYFRDTDEPSAQVH